MIFRPDLILIDGTSYIYRAFHALPPLTTSSGKPTGATRGFAAMLRKLIEKYPGVPMVMVFDAKGPNFRNDYFKDYKANRPPMPNELRVQIEDIKKLSKLFNFTVKEEGGVEADDVIATLTKQFKLDKKILISSPDKDLTQLVEDNVIQHNSMSNEFFNNEYVKEKFGVGPSQVAQLLALVGDKADNIPGITKVGNKTASKWLNAYGNLENIINKSDEITGVVGQNLREEKEVLQRNLFLVSLKQDINLDLLFDDINIPASSSDGLKEFYKELEFNSFIGETNEKRKSEYTAITNKNELEKKYYTPKTYDELKSMKYPNKTKKISCVVSSKQGNNITDGYFKTTTFIRKYSQLYPNKIDIYGRGWNKYVLGNNYKGALGSYHQEKNITTDKSDALLDYHYSIALENL